MNRTSQVLELLMTKGHVWPKVQPLHSHERLDIARTLAHRLGIRHDHELAVVPIRLQSRLGECLDIDLSQWPHCDEKNEFVKFLSSDNPAYLIFQIFEDALQLSAYQVPEILLALFRDFPGGEGAFVFSADLTRGWSIENDGASVFEIDMS